MTSDIVLSERQLEAQHPASRGRPLGFACMPFEVPLTRSPQEWVNDVRRGLEQMATVSNIRIDVAPEHLPEPPDDGEDDGEPVHDNYRDSFWVEPVFGAIAFDVHIPVRLQKDILADGVVIRRRVGAEQFRVSTVYGFEGPCTFIWVLDEVDPSDVDVSGAVILVHRFMSKELERGATGVRMARVGPSPFHMNAVLCAAGEPQEEEIAVVRLAMYGYESVEFRYDPDLFDSIEEAAAALEGALSSQLCLYYWLVRMKNQHAKSIGDLAQKTQNLVKFHSQGGVGGWLTRLFRTSGEARKLGLLALGARTTEAEQARGAAAAIKTVLAQSDTVPAFEPYLHELAEVDNEASISNAREVVQFVEAGRRSEFEVLMISAATVLGGVAGGVVGFIATSAAGGT